MRRRHDAQRHVRRREPLDDDALLVDRHGHHLEPDEIRRPARVDLPGILHRDPARALRSKDPHDEPLGLREAVRDHHSTGRRLGGAHAVEVARERLPEFQRSAAVEIAEIPPAPR